MPTCGLFGSLSSLSSILQVAQGVSDDLSSMCFAMSEFINYCFGKIENQKGCQSVNKQSISCSNDALNYFLLGKSGASLCGLTDNEVVLYRKFNKITHLT